MKKRSIDPGQRSTRDEALKAELEAMKLIRAVEPLHRKKAARHVRMWVASNPLASEAIAGMATLVRDLESGSRRERLERRDALFRYAWEQGCRAGTLAALFAMTTTHAARLSKKFNLR